MNDQARTQIERIIARLDRIADELNAGPRLNQHSVTSRGEFLDDFERSVEASDWQTRRAELAEERRLLTTELERLTETDESRS
jgi:hypothetical protein